MLTPARACWLCSMPMPNPERIAVHRWSGWWQVTQHELDALGRAHVGLRRALNEGRPTEALMARCYDALRRHGLEPIPPE
jgi:hypothetical protein